MTQPLTNQEIFDKVSTHLLKQGRQALSSDGDCIYRSRTGSMRCAVGCMLVSDAYDPGMEGSNVKGIFEQYPQEMGMSGLTEDNLGLLTALQDIHDNHDSEDWAYTLRQCAIGFKLKYKG